MKKIISIILTITILFSMGVTASVSAATATTAEPYDIVKWDGTIVTDNKGTISTGPVTSGSLYPTDGITTTKYAISVLKDGTGTGFSTVERATGDNCYSIDYSNDLRYDPSTNFNFYAQVTNAKLNKPVFSVMYDIMIPNDANANAERTFTPSFTTANGKSGALGSTDYGEFAVKYANGTFSVDSLVGIDTETAEYANAEYTPGSWVTVEVRAYYDATTTKLTYGVYVDDTQIMYGAGTTLYPSMIYLDRALWHQPSMLTYYDNICMRTLAVDDKPVNITSGDPEPGPSPEPEPEPEPPAEPEIPYENGELLFDYNLNKDFAETELGKRVIIDKFDSVEKYNTEISYEDDGIKISHKGEPIFTNDAKTGGATVDAFGINLTELMSDVNGNNVYKTGYNGVYALEYTFNVVQGDGWDANKSTGRADLFIDDSTGTFENKNNIEIRMPFKPAVKNQIVMWNDKDTLFNLGTFENGIDMTVCFVIDTKNNTVDGYTKLANGSYEKNGTGTHSLSAITGLWYRIRSYCQDGDSITFKNIKLYEIEKNTEYSGSLAYEKFVANLPESIVSDADNVVENIVVPEAVTKAGTVSTLNEDLVKVDGTVTRRFEDTKTGLAVSGNSNGIYYEKVYSFTVKAMEGAENTKLADYDFASKNIEYVNTVNGTVTADGYKLINNKQRGEAVGMLKTLGTADVYTNTYYYDHTGAYDFEISLNPDVTDGTAVVEIGNYTKSNGFVPFGTVKITADKIVYCGEDDVVAVKENTSGNNYDIKFRTYTDEKGMWISVNSKEISQLPYSYTANKNILNAYRVGFENGTANDSIVIEDASLTRLLKAVNTELEQTITAADSIGIYDVSANPDNAYGAISLPTISGYDVKWSTNNPLADLEQGKVFCTEDDTDIVISAVISPKNKPDTKVLKEFKLKVLGTDDPQYLLEGALAKIVPEKITNQNVNAIIADLEFPNVTVEGYGITWDSLNDGIISDDGIINKNINISDDTKVTFKATVTAPSGSASKEISFTIAKRGAAVACNIADVSEYAEGVVAYSAKVSNTNGSMYLHDGNDNKIVGFSIANSKLIFENGTEYSISGDSFTIKAVMNSTDRKVSVYVDDKLVLDYVAYTEKAAGFKAVANSGLTISDEKVVFDEYSLFDYNVKLFDYFDNLGEGYIYSNVVLKTNSVGGVNVVWASSDDSIFTNQGNYTVQDSISYFDVTAKLTVNGGTSAYYEKTTECVAVPAEDRNVITGATVITDIKEDVTNDRTKGLDNNFSTYFVGTRINENSYITIDMGGLNDINSLYFFREADDTNLKSCDIYVSENGVEWGSPVASVNFTDLQSNHVKFNMQTVRYIKIANIVTENGSIKLYEIKGYISYSSDDKAYKDIMALDMPADYVLNASSITLPTSGSLYGSTLVWKSSDESVISTDGTINKPSGKKEKEVVLTVTATLEGKTAVKSFKYLVKGNGKASGGAGGAGGGGSYGGNIAGVNTGGTTIAALPTQNDIIQTPSQDNLKTEFKDVKTTDWFFTYLMKLKNNGVIDGYEDGNFYPNNKITREEFVKMLVNVAGFELVEEYEGFEDVSEDDWFAPYVYTAKKLNIVSGIDEASFGVGNPISRQDMSVMIYNVITMKKTVSASKDKFADDSTISDYASNAVYSMKALEILNGYEDGTFNPKGNLTRAEASKVISMIMDMQ